MVTMPVVGMVGVAHRGRLHQLVEPLAQGPGPGGSDTPTRQKKVSPAPGQKPPGARTPRPAPGPLAISGNAENDLPLRAYQRKISGVIWGCRCRPTAAAVSHTAAARRRRARGPRCPGAARRRGSAWAAGARAGM